jgi:hypothetical protein
MKKKSEIVRWRVTFTDDIIDRINPTVNYIRKYADEYIFSVYIKGMIEGIIVGFKRTNLTVTQYFTDRAIPSVMSLVIFNLWKVKYYKYFIDRHVFHAEEYKHGRKTNNS